MLIGLNQGIAGLLGKSGTAGSSSLLRSRPIIQNSTILSAEATLLRGVTMALDGPGSEASVYTTNRDNWQKFRDLNLNIVRVPFSVEYENNTLASMLPDMDATVANASATGMYCMFMLDGAYGAANYAEFGRVWPTVAARYKDNTNVLYEMNNEPHFTCAEFSNSEYDQVANIYNLMHTAAPNTLIGVLTPASLDSGAQAAINAVNALKSRGVTFGPAFLSFHAYGNYQRTQVQQVKAAVPCMLTETTFIEGSADYSNDDNLFKLEEMERVGVSWMDLSPRFGEVTNIKSPYSNDEKSFTDRVLVKMHSDGFNWSQDNVNAQVRALPGGSLFQQTAGFSGGIASTRAAGSIPGKVYAVAASLAKGTATATTGTATLPKSISLTPANPGTISETSAGSGGSWTTTINRQNVASVTWAIIAASGTQRGTSNVIAANGVFTITPVFIASGEKLRVWETGNTAINVDSGAVTLNRVTKGITIEPRNPGTVSSGIPVTTTITTSGISNFTYVVVNADYGWTSAGTAVPVNSSSDSKIINPVYTAEGQFLKVFETADPNFAVDGGAVTLGSVVVTPAPGAGFYEDFANNTTGQLTHVWGNRDQLSINNGILRLQGLAGLDPWANACGVMMFPGGADQGFGYGLYEIRLRQAAFLGDGSGAGSGLWPADDIWPGCEEDMGEISAGGDWYPAHHWKGPPDENGDPTDRFEYFAKPGFNPTQFFTSQCRLKRDYLEFLVNGTLHASTRNNVTRVYGDGPEGCNRVPFIMNRSSNTWIEVDWIKFTPESP